MDKELVRQKHIIWTLSGRYKIKPRSILFDDISIESMRDLRLAVIGGLYRYIPQKYIDDYLLRIVGLGDSTKYYIELLPFRRICHGKTFSP